MSRTIFTLALLLLAATAQGMTPARQGASGSSGQCPQAQVEAAAAIAAPATVPPTVADPAAPTATVATPPIAPKRDTLSRPTAATRWHSFLPGMFK